MSLRLRQAISGRPSTHTNQNVGAIRIDEKAYTVYPSSSNVILLNPELELEETLQFWSALPRRAASSSDARVEGICCSSAERLIIAWTNVHVVIWYHSKSRSKASWNIHSTLVLSSPITSLDYQSGTLVLGTKSGIELWRTDLKADIVVWDRVWERSYTSTTRVIVSPSLSHVAWYSQHGKSVFVIGLDRKGGIVGIPQELRHPREISYISWRKSPDSSADAFLYTITTNSVFRIYSPVLDDPVWFQLLFTLDSTALTSVKSKENSSKGKAVDTRANLQGTIWPLDASILQTVVSAELRNEKKIPGPEVKKVLESLQEGEGDLVMWVGQDGVVSLRSILNIDRKPPTLLKSVPVARFTSPRGSIDPQKWAPSALLLHIPTSSSTVVVLPPNETNPSIRIVKLSLSDLLLSSPSSLRPVKHSSSGEETIDIHLVDTVDHFTRTPNGRGLLAMGASGEIGVWYKERLAKVSKTAPAPRALVGKGQWVEHNRPTLSTIFSKGRAIVFYTKTGDTGTITLQHLDHDASSPTPPVTVPDFHLEEGDDLEMLLAVSDIDDGYSGRGRRTQRAFIMAASKKGHAWVWRADSRFISVASAESIIDDAPDLCLLSHFVLPVEGGKPHLILPVDPMGWHHSVIDWKNNAPLQDMILIVSEDGVLEFWSPELGHHFEGEKPHNERVPLRGRGGHFLHDGHEHEEASFWKRTGVVRTGRTKALMARCSSRKKTVLVCQGENGQEMTIWDSNVSEFSTGLELTHFFESGEVIQDLDWTTTSDLQSVLAVGFPHRVILVCEQRMSYVESTPGWAPFLTINLEQYTSVPISDSIWLAGGSLAIGAGNQIYLFSRFLDRDTPLSSPATSVKSVTLDTDEPEDIFQLIAWQNGPLWDYHPVVLAQCLLWDKIDLVKSILIELARCLTQCERSGKKRLSFNRLEPLDFYARRKTAKHTSVNGARKYDSLFASAPSQVDDEDEFSPRLVSELVDQLDGQIVIPLSRAEKSMLATVAQATLEVERERRSLDLCGLRYLISIRMLVNISRLSGLSGTVTPISNDASAPAIKLSFRNFVWALHSDSQEMLLQAATQCCHGCKMLWPEAKRLGVFLWLKNQETVKSMLEVIARNRFMAEEDRDPVSCSLIFFALNKKKVVHGLWRQAPGHQEQQLMLKFLANDFELERWKTAAIKNAYALLAKQRYEYAAAFFMLGGCPKDAINVCLRQLNDWQLGFALARAVEGGTDGPIVKWILSDTVVPLAMAGGHRWLATWAFWTLGRRDLAVRILISPMVDVAEAWSTDTLPVGNPENDDPSLLLLFQHLKSKSLQTAKGTSEIPEKTEFDFVLHNARVFFRMGCHSLALDLLHSWSFERPFFPAPTPIIRSRIPSPSPLHSRAPSAADTGTGTGTPLPETPKSKPRRPSLSGMTTSSSFIRPSPRRPSFMLSAHTRRDSMVMDMDVLTEAPRESPLSMDSPVTSAVTPSVNGASVLDGEIEEEEDEEEEKEERATEKEPQRSETPKVEREEEQPRKMGNLMKELKQDVQQGAMEFDMDNFF